MKIIQSLIKQIGGELQIGRGDHDRGARFTILFNIQPPSRPIENGVKIAVEKTIERLGNVAGWPG
jgi:hypothetical protein